MKALEYGHNRLITTEVMKLRETAKADPSALSTVRVSGISPVAGTSTVARRWCVDGIDIDMDALD